MRDHSVRLRPVRLIKCTAEIGLLILISPPSLANTQVDPKTLAWANYHIWAPVDKCLVNFTQSRSSDGVKLSLNF